MEDFKLQKQELKHDDLLIEASAGGNLNAFGQLYDRYASRLYSNALTISGNSQDAAEVVHDVFIAFLRNAGRFRGNSALAFSWMTVNTRSRCLEKMGCPGSAGQRRMPRELSDMPDASHADYEPRMILESITDAFFSLDPEWRFTYLNPQTAAILGRPPRDLMGKRIWDEYPGLIDSEFEPVYLNAAVHRVGGSITSFYPDHQRWYEVSTHPAARGLSVYFCDVSKAQEDAGIRAQNLLPPTA